MELTHEALTALDGLSMQEREIALSILQSGDLTELVDLYNVDYDEIPVTIDQFVSDPKYLGSLYDKGELVYPFWKEFMHNFFHNNPDKAFEIALSGAIGIGKSTVAAIMMTYIIYKTLCLKNPREFYHLTGNSPIVFVVMNLTLDLAYAGLYTLIVENIKESPWFQNKVEIRGKYDYIIEFGNGIQLIAGSNTNHVIGKNVISAILDEVSFSNAPKGSKNSVMDMYRSIRRRMESRFMRGGNLPGMIGLISSKNDENSFLERYIDSNRENRKTWIVDKPIYEIKPASTYLGPRFKVAVGDKTKESFIIDNDADMNRAEQSNQRIIEVPVEYETAFRGDINEALKEIAGISAVSSSKLIPYPGRISSCIDKKHKSPLMQETIYLSLDPAFPDESIMDYLEDLSILKKDVHLPRFIHTDIALKGDSLGMGIVHVDKTVTVDRTSTDGTLVQFTEPHFYVDMALRVRAPQGSEIPLYKIREFILWLRKNVYKKIETVSFDGFQSADSIQILKTAKFNTELVSVDRTDIPYLNLRAAILENRINLYDHSILYRELSDLEYDRNKKKVDHPETTINNQPGSKDVADGICGACYDAMTYYTSKIGAKAYGQDKRVARNIETLKKYRDVKRLQDAVPDLGDVKWLM